MFAAVWALIERGSGLEAGWFGKVRWLRSLNARIDTLALAGSFTQSGPDREIAIREL